MFNKLRFSSLFPKTALKYGTLGMKVRAGNLIAKKALTFHDQARKLNAQIEIINNQIGSLTDQLSVLHIEYSKHKSSPIVKKYYAEYEEAERKAEEFARSAEESFNAQLAELEDTIQVRHLGGGGTITGADMKASREAKEEYDRLFSAGPSLVSVTFPDKPDIVCQFERLRQKINLIESDVLQKREALNSANNQLEMINREINEIQPLIDKNSMFFKPMIDLLNRRN